MLGKAARGDEQVRSSYLETSHGVHQLNGVSSSSGAEPRDVTNARVEFDSKPISKSTEDADFVSSLNARRVDNNSQDSTFTKRGVGARVLHRGMWHPLNPARCAKLARWIWFAVIVCTHVLLSTSPLLAPYLNTCFSHVSKVKLFNSLPRLLDFAASATSTCVAPPTYNSNNIATMS